MSNNVLQTEIKDRKRLYTVNLYLSSSKAYSTGLQETRSNLLVASLDFVVDNKEEHKQEHKRRTGTNYK